jgi:hypothetical protein
LKLRLDLSDEGYGEVTADVVAVAVQIGMKLYAVNVLVDDAPVVRFGA